MVQSKCSIGEYLLTEKYYGRLILCITRNSNSLCGWHHWMLVRELSGEINLQKGDDIQNYITDIENMKYVDYEYWLDNRLSEIERDLGY